MSFKKIIQKPTVKIGLALVLLFLGIYFIGPKKEKKQDFEVVTRKDLIEKVSASGQIVPLKDLDLQFEKQGRVDQVKVNIGQEIDTGETLISLEDNNSKFDLLSAQAAKKIAQANLNQILSGPTSEEIKVYESLVKQAEADLQKNQDTVKSEEIDLKNMQNSTKVDLQNSYEDALNTLLDTYSKGFNASKVMQELQRDYFQSSNQESLKIKNNTAKIINNLDESKNYLGLAENGDSSDIDEALEKFKNNFTNIKDSIKEIREITEKPPYRGDISTSDKTSLENQESYINTALSNIVNAQQEIISTKNTNKVSINAAEASLNSAQNSLLSAQANLEYNQNKLNELKATAEDYEINLYEGKLEQAEASLAQAQENYQKTILKSPCNGLVSDINIEEGEIAKTTNNVISLICQNAYQIEAEIPESDISKIDIKDEVIISLDAFPNQKFKGRVNEINPAATEIQGVIYYKIKIIFDNFNQSIKPGMTTDIEVVTEKKEDILTIPQRLLIRKNGQKILQVLIDDQIEERVVITGISNNQGEIEIISGVNEGDKIIR